jgi:primosomal protein N' (replication factor Y)
VDEAARLAMRLRRNGRDVALVPRDWARAAAGGVTVVGARGAAWAPVPGLAVVVVLDAHDEGYAEERAPTWNAWRVAAQRADRAGVPCVLVSPWPPVDADRFGPVLVPSRREERAGWAAFEVVDRTKDDPRTGLFSPRLVTLLRSGGRVVCVLNRKGRAKLLACAACGAIGRCERCGAAVEQDEGQLRCRRCQLARPTVCATCGSQKLKTLRAGVTRVREEMEALAGVPVGEVTGETGELPDTAVVVGTEAVLHRVGPPVDGVAFLDFDQELLAPRYRAGEEALALLVRAARLVGPRDGGGRVLVQTRLPRHEAVMAALHADPERLLSVERERRAELRFPPHTAMALISGEAAAEFVEHVSGLEVLGPDEGRWLVRARDHNRLCDALAAVARPAGRLRVEVDPVRA